jgi:acyl-coenzyme A synthetase/AMP-(fatty) acid ligase
VQEVAVVGVPSELTDEDVAAFVVPRPGAKLDAADVTAWCRTRLADFKAPRHIWLVESLPKTETQRTEKYHLRQLARDLLSGSGQVPDQESASQ